MRFIATVRHGLKSERGGFAERPSDANCTTSLLFMCPEGIRHEAPLRSDFSPWRTVAITAVVALNLATPAARSAQGNITIASAPAPFVWGETTTFARGGWGRMTHLKDGRWLGVKADYPHPNSILHLQTSADGGKTWIPGAVIAAPGRNLDNGEVRQLPDGAILLTGRSVVLSETPGAKLSYSFPVYRSTDGGVTWKPVGTIDSSDPAPFKKGRPSQGLWEPMLFLLPDGRVACAYANEKHSIDRHTSYSQVVSERISADDGATWGPEIMLAAQVGGGAQRPGMPVITRLKDGRYLAVFEVVGVGNADVYEKFSPDGMHWPLGTGAVVPDQHAGPFVTTLDDGRVVVSSCSNQISVSNDSGVTWRTTPPAFPDLGQVFSWPAIYQTAPDQIVVMTTRDAIRLRWGRIVAK